MSDFAVMRQGAVMAVASSRVTSTAINQLVDPEALGGWKLHAETTGLIDVVVDSDEAALEVIKTYLSYLPGHCMEAPPEVPVLAGSDDAVQQILDMLPENRKRVYDMRDVITAIVDKESLFELKPDFGPSLVTAFTRLNGKTLGVIANNPKFKGGAIDVDAMRKATSFLVQCDSFNVPILLLIDQPGFLIGIAGERQAAPGKIINWMNALSLVTVPKISLILRKDYGQAYLNMGGGQNSDAVVLWPTADLGFMDPEVGVSVLHNLKREDDPERFERLRAELERDTSAWDLAAVYEGHMVIDPRETRSVLIDLFETYRGRLTNGVGQHLLRAWPTSF
jgi:acetyl-CoA carboxylase carboxyltransferase component